MLRGEKNNNNTHTIESAEGSQQEDCLSGLEFCDTVHPTLAERTSKTKLDYMDDFNLEGKVSDAARDVQAIIDAQKNNGFSAQQAQVRDNCEQL